MVTFNKIVQVIMQLLTRLDKSLGRCDIIITDKSIKNAISFIKESQVQMEGLLGP